MPEGDRGNYFEPNMVGNYGEACTLLDHVSYLSANGSHVYVGQWVSVPTIKTATVEIQGTFTGTVNIEGTNDPNPNTNNPAGNALIASAPTSAGLSALSPMPVRWVRARMTSFTAGSLSAYFHGVA